MHPLIRALSLSVAHSLRAIAVYVRPRRTRLRMRSPLCSNSWILPRCNNRPHHPLPHSLTHARAQTHSFSLSHLVLVCSCLCPLQNTANDKILSLQQELHSAEERWEADKSELNSLYEQLLSSQQVRQTHYIDCRFPLPVCTACRTAIRLQKSRVRPWLRSSKRS